jgi:mRNA interferase RelE/StbE
MTFALQLSPTARKALDKLPPNTAKKIVIHLEEIRLDPYRPRPKADIVPVAGRKTYRLRVGKIRVEYEVCENVIRISKIFQKKRKTDYL